MALKYCKITFYNKQNYRKNLENSNFLKLTKKINNQVIEQDYSDKILNNNTN